MNLPPLLHVIGAERVASQDGRTLPTIDPSTEEVIGHAAVGGPADVARAVDAADAARFGDWREVTPAERGEKLFHLAALMAAHREELARLEARDVGKPLTAARGDIDGVVATLRYNAGAADKIEGTVIPLGEQLVDFTWLQPVGVTAHIVPWNYPLGMAFRSLASALAAGCTAVVKPAEQSPLSLLRAMDLVAQVFPAGVVNVVCGDGATGAALVAHPKVAAVAFTGSVATGRKVGEAAARGMKPAVLELGGKNALIVAADADLDRALACIMEGGFENAGQVCSASAWVLAHRDIAAELGERLAARAAALRVGPAFDDLDMGPLVSAAQRDRAVRYAAEAMASGVRVLTGGGRPAHLSRGFFMAPTVFADVDPALPIAREEVFGPVVTITPYESDAQALAMVNALPTGLVAGVMTRDISRALSLARELDTGSVWINGWYLGGVQAPTGGTKDSGLGRERGQVGVRNFLRVKNVAIRL